MQRRIPEKGQALILIALAAVGLFAFAGLAIDGSRAYSDKRHAQNAADTAALAGALAYARGTSITDAAQARAISNGYDGLDHSDVTIRIDDSPPGVCPAHTEGKDITVTIVSQIDTTFARIIGRTQVTNAVTATARTCGSYTGPPFDGNVIVTLAPSGKGYDGTGTPDWIIEGGGIFSNSTSSDAAYCNGSTAITAPSITVVGMTDLRCHGLNITTTTTNAPPYTSYESIAGLLPPEPACDGTATLSAGKWYPEPGTDGSRVAFNGTMDFAPGLYCVTNSPGPYHGELTGEDVTFYVMNPDFSMTFNGSGNSFNATAPTTGNYRGVLMYLAPQVDGNGNLIQTQELDLRGNGSGDISGTIIAPSANVTLFGNSTGVLNTQVIGYHVDSGGTANIHLKYHVEDNYQTALPIKLMMLK